MPYYSYREIKTPLRFLNVRLFREVHDGTIWVKAGNNPRKRLFKKA